MKTVLLHTVLAVLLLFVAACQKQSPVELVDDDLEQNNLEIINTTPPSLPGLDGTDVDSLIPPVIDQKSFGQIILAGALIDMPGERHTSVLARAIFFNSDSLLVNGRDTLYRSIDVGDVDIDGRRLFRVHKLSPRSRVDTLGVQYVLGGRDGVGGRGLQYRSGFNYSWTGSGSSPVQPFSISLQAADSINVTSPGVNDLISVRKNLPVTWTGGSTSLQLVISAARAGEKPLPLFRFKIRVNRGKAVIPSTILQLLPRTGDQFLFSFISEHHESTTIAGFGDRVLVQSVYSHNLLLRVQR